MPSTFQTGVPSAPDKIHSVEDIQAKVPRLLKWPRGDTRVTVVIGGTTNRLFRLTHPTEAPVLVRIYGGEDVFTPADRARESIIFEQLGNAHIGPPLRAKFANGRIEGCLDARPLDLHEMTARHVGDGIAVNMARLHTFHPVGVDENEPPKTRLWSLLDDWARRSQRIEQEKCFESAGIDVDRCVRALQAAPQEVGSNDIVFAHNDLHAGNILLGEGGVTLIDFEYSDYNYRAFDIGNYFAECMGGCADGIVRPHLYPSLKFRRYFCVLYLTQLHGEAPTPEAVDELVDDAERFGLVSHLYWGFWALVQSSKSAIDFPYVDYARQRFEQFFHRCDWA